MGPPSCQSHFRNVVVTFVSAAAAFRLRMHNPLCTLIMLGQVPNGRALIPEPGARSGSSLKNSCR